MVYIYFLMSGIDGAIIKACIKQDTKASYALYRYCFALLMPVCYRYTRNEEDAADLLNKGFLKIHTNLARYSEDRLFDAWARKIMMNTIIDEYRNNKTYKETMMNVDMSDLGQQYHPVDWNEAEARINNKELKKYIDKLPEASKVVLNLFVFDGLSHKEIASQLSISEGTSKWHLNHARVLLKKMMSGVLSTLKMYVL